MASAGLTAEEIADLLAPGSAPQCERWIKPLVVYDFRQREGMKMMTLSANAQRIGDDIMRLVNAGNESGSLRTMEDEAARAEKAVACGRQLRLGKAETVAARQSGSIGS